MFLRSMYFVYWDEQNKPFYLESQETNHFHRKVRLLHQYQFENESKT